MIKDDLKLSSPLVVQGKRVSTQINEFMQLIEEELMHTKPVQSGDTSKNIVYQLIIEYTNILETGVLDGVIFGYKNVGWKDSVITKSSNSGQYGKKALYNVTLIG